MRTILPRLLLIIAIVSILPFLGCNKNGSEQNEDDSIFSIDSTVVEVLDTTKTVEHIDSLPQEVFNIDPNDSAMEVLKQLPAANLYMKGIFPSIAKYAPEYVEKLLYSGYSKFIVVDKARMKVLLYDKYGHVVKEYGMACAKKYGTKHNKADSRTPEGFFSVEGIYDSTDWLFTDDNGKTSKQKGQFGPRFIRIKIPGTSQIGIHGTCAPWSIGSRASHGCIRITNENIMELVELVQIGMPVIILPGKKDRAVNREEGYEIAYFPTSPNYAVSKSELNASVKKENSEEESNSQKDTVNTGKSLEHIDTVSVQHVDLPTDSI